MPRYEADLQSDNGVTVTLYNLAQNGWHSGNLLNALQTKATFQTAVAEANVITWNIGTGDLNSARDIYKNGKCGAKGHKDNQDCLKNMVTTFEANWNGIVNQILARRSLTNTAIRTMDILYPWVAADQASNTTPDSEETGPARGNDFAVLNYYLSQMNAYIALTSFNSGIPVAAVHVAFNGSSGTEDPVAKGYIASDGLHPNDAGHAVIATAFRNLGYAPLR